MLGSRDYAAVDGALTPLRLFYSSGPLLDDNNHLLFPLETYLWVKALSLFAIKATNPFAFLRIVQSMNAVAAAGSVALVFVIVRDVTQADPPALLAACGFALSRALLMHATNSAQPIVGLFFSLAATTAAILANREKSRAWFFGTGILLAVAMASYETMVLVGAGLLLIAAAARRVPSFLGGCFGGWLLTFGVAYAYSGTGAALMPGRFATSVGMPSASVGFHVSSVINLPVGLAGALLPGLPNRYLGVRWLFAEADWLTAFTTTIVVMGVLGLLLWIGLALWRERATLGIRTEQALAFSGIALLAMLLPLTVVNNPLYDKLWLQPTAALFVMSAIIVHGTRARSALVCMIILVASELVTNVPIAIGSMMSPTPHLDEAGEVANRVGPSDLLVTEWDDISRLYMAFWPERQVFCLPSEAGYDGSAAVGRLARRVEQTTQSGSSVFFLAVLDANQKEWNRGYMIKTGIDFASLQQYRNCSSVVEKFLGKGGFESLRRLKNRSCNE
jgi:hypothetical protein